METEDPTGDLPFDPNNPGVLEPLVGTDGADTLTIRAGETGFTAFAGGGGDQVTVESLSGQFALALISVSNLLNETPDGTGFGETSDGAQDNVTVGSEVFAAAAEGGLASGVVVVTDFGPEDRLALQGISGDQAQVLLDIEVPNISQLGSTFTGTTITVDNVAVHLVGQQGQPTFESQADFNQRVTFGNGGTPNFTPTETVESILEQFLAGGGLPTQEIPGVFELPDPPDEDDVVIDIPPITIDIGGEPVEITPGDPFFFDDLTVEQREALLSDPELAIGYDYRIPDGSNAFATVEAPSVNGDDEYQLIAFNGETAQDPVTLPAGETLDFEQQFDFPVTHFIIRDIAPAAQLDPENATAFPTSLSFTQSGTVDLQQTPLIRGFEFGADDADAKAESIAAIYVGYYGRAPDPGGLDFWIGELDNALAGEGQHDAPQSLDQALNRISEAIRQNDEVQSNFPFLDPDAAGPASQADIEGFVNSVYQNLFNRPAEAGGLEFWTGVIEKRLEDGTSIGDTIIDIISGAQGDDAVVVGNKIDVAQFYGESFPDADWTVDGDRAQAVDIIAQVAGTDASVAAARDAVNEAIAADSASQVAPTGMAPQDDAVLMG